MFIGHFAVGFAAKSVQPKVSLGTYFLAAQFLDLLWPTFLLLRWETVEIDPGNTVMTPLNFINYPYTHSLVMAFCWAGLFSLIYYLSKKNSSAALLLGICVLSHWILDLLVHRPDLPVFPGESVKLGIGLWNHPLIATILEAAIFISAVWWYVSTSKAKNKKGKYILWSLILFLVIIQVMNMLGPPPPDVKSIAIAGHLQWLFVFWAYWTDWNREVDPS